VLAESTSGMMLLKREQGTVDAIGHHESPRGDWDLRATLHQVDMSFQRRGG